MSDKKDPTKPTRNDEKFKPQNVADGSPSGGQNERDMKDVPRGSEGDRRRSAQHRSG
ncbi:hypothetical protein [Aurantiacibacter suaedae]|uniref:hypothetical protein n=1 Tax=Aurantiacibacter suaedae TaxID=2545755 RepID=UPI0013C33F74|nr:hypothetical protein [Aurantiacibacter suaedae]